MPRTVDSDGKALMDVRAVANLERKAGKPLVEVFAAEEDHGGLLPDTFRSGTIVQGPKGDPNIKVIRTSQRDDHGEVLYRLVYLAGTVAGMWMPECRAHTLRSRDDLQEWGCKIISVPGEEAPEEDVKEE